MPYGGIPGRQRSGTTIASGVMAIVLSALWCLVGIVLLFAAAFFDAATDDTPDWADDLSDGVAAVFLLMAAVVLACAIWSIVAAANLIRRRSWARMATIITFSIWSALAGLGFIGTLTGEESEGGDVVLALIWFSACALVVAFAAVRATREDVESAARAGDWGGGMPPPGVQPPYGAPAPPYGAPPGPGGPPPAQLGPPRF